MSWNKVFDYFIEIKHTIGDNFDIAKDFKELTANYGTKEQYNRIKDLQLCQYGNLILIRYGNYSNIFSGETEEFYHDYWNLYDGFYKECRSLVVDLVAEEMVLTPYKKFLNMNECEENSLENIIKRISNAVTFEISDKLDGSMVSARYYNNEYVLSTSGALNPLTGWRLKQAYEFLTEDIKTMLREYPNTTFIFEILSEEDRHVVHYDDENYGLHLIGARNVIHGSESSYNTVKLIGEQYNVKCVEIENITFEQMLNEMKTIKSDKKEGWVLNIDGYRVKVKCDDYVQIHKLLSYTSSPKTIIKSIVENNFDDLISKVPKNYKRKILDIYDEVINYQHYVLIEIDKYKKLVDKKKPKDKKEFMQLVEKLVPPRLKAYVRNVYLGYPIGILKSNSGKLVTMKDIERYYDERNK